MQLTEHAAMRSSADRLSRLGLEEPMGYVDGMSLYEYVGSNPGVHTDAMGLASSTTQPSHSNPSNELVLKLLELENLQNQGQVVWKQIRDQ